MNKYLTIFLISAFTSYITFLYWLKIREPEVQEANFKREKGKNATALSTFLMPFVATNKSDPSTYANANPINGGRTVPIYEDTRGFKFGIATSERPYRFM